MTKTLENPSKNVEVFFTINDSYAKYLSVTLVSILKNARPDEHYNFYVLTSDISEENKNKLNSIKTNTSYEIEFINIQKDLFDVVAESSQKHISKETNYRFLISSIKPNMDKCIFLDADLVVEHSLWDLMNQDIENYSLAAVNDIPYTIKGWLDETILPKKYTYKNTGVILVNLKKWRSDNIENKLFENSEKYADDFLYPDQDALNVTLASDIKTLKDEWNVFPCFSLYKEQTFDKPKVIHWAGYIKPWNRIFCHSSHHYWLYAFLSPHFKDLVKDIVCNIKLYRVFRILKLIYS